MTARPSNSRNRGSEDNVKGRQASLLQLPGFESVERRGRMSTVLGTLEFLSAVRVDFRPAQEILATGELAICT